MSIYLFITVLILSGVPPYTGKTFTAEEQKERAAKALKLNDNDRFINPGPRLFEIPTKPTVRIKRLKPDLPIKRLKGASAFQDKLLREKEKAEKALKLNSLFS
jgi:hypothetical protein